MQVQETLIFSRSLADFSRDCLFGSRLDTVYSMFDTSEKTNKVERRFPLSGVLVVSSFVSLDVYLNP